MVSLLGERQDAVAANEKENAANGRVEPYRARGEGDLLRRIAAINQARHTAADRHHEKGGIDCSPTAIAR